MAEKVAWSKAAAEALALHETFRRLGFPADELFVHMYDGGMVQFVLKRKGEQFVIDIGRVENVENFRKEYLEAIEWWNGDASTNGERQEVYHFSKTKHDQPFIVTALTKRGFLPL